MRRDSLPIPQVHLPRLALSVAICAASQGWAAPSGGVVQQGDAQINTGTHTQIHQTSQGAEISWDRFDIGANESVTFHVPNSQSYTLNHIHDFKPSEIYGNLSSNGTVILANPNGIYFGAGSSVNVNAMVATTANVTLDGHQLTLTPSGQPAAIEHWGETTAAQSLAFFAPRLEIGGLIDSANIELSNHSTGVVTLLDSGIGYLVNDDVADQLAQEGIRVSGELRAAGGYVGLSTSAMDSLANSALNMEGLVSVSSMTEDAGQVVLRSDQGTTWFSGDIDASSTVGKGGDISIQGHQVGVVGQASVRADGAAGGGTIDIGSGVMGEIDRASQVFAGQNTRITANATQEGDGGTIDLWSADVTRVYGRLEAIGAGAAGSGGFIETSSEQILIADADVDVSAPGGNAGTWLLDPGDIYIRNQANDNLDESGPGIFTNLDDSQETTLSISSLLNALENANVTVQTTALESDIYLEDILDLASAEYSLTLEAIRDIHLNADIINGINFNNANNYNVPLTLQAGGSIYTTAHLIEVGTLNLDAGAVFSSDALTVNAYSVFMQDGSTWTAFGDLSFYELSNISSLVPGENSSLSFELDNTDLTLAAVGQFGGLLNEFSVQGVNALTLSGNLKLGSADLDLSSGVNQIRLDGPADGIAIITDGGDISLANVIGTGFTHSLNVSNGASAGSTISLGGMSGINNLFVASGGDIELNWWSMNVMGGISLLADRVNLYNGWVQLYAQDGIFVSGDIEGHAGGDSKLIMDAPSLDLQSIGLNSTLEGIYLYGGEATVGNYLQSNTMQLATNELILLEDTTILAMEAYLGGTQIFALGNQTLSIDAKDLNLGSVEAGSLTVISENMQLWGDLKATAGGIDLGDVDQLTLFKDAKLQSSGNGVLTLSNDISGVQGFGLDLTVQNGALNLGSQNNADPLAYLHVTNLNPGAGQNTIGGDIHVVNALKMDQSGSFTFTPIDPTATGLTLTTDAGSLRLDGSTLNLQGHDLTVSAANGTAWFGSVMSANDVIVSAQEMRLGGAIVAAGSLDLGGAGALNLIGNSQLTGNLSLGTTNDNVAINGHYSLSINNLGHSLTLYEIGANQALTSLAVTGVDTLRTVESLNTQGLGGVTLAGNQWLLTEDAQINTAGANGTINLSGIAVNGPHTLTLNAGDGTVALGAVGQSGRLESLILQQASTLELGGNISTDDERLNFSVVQAIELTADTRIDSSPQDGNIDLGTGSIDGTFDLTLISGDGELVMGSIGQNIALQNLILDTTSGLTLDQSINVVDLLQVTADNLTTNGRLSSTGGQVQLYAAEGIAMGAQAEAFGYEGVTFETAAGDIGLGFVEAELGGIEMLATEGSILNAIGDFVNIKDTSVNLKGPKVSLIAGESIGTGPVDPIVLDVATDGVISLDFGEPVAYIVNINGTAITQTSDGFVFDTLLETQQATTRLSAESMPTNAPWRLAMNDESLTQLPDSLLFAVTQPGFQIPSNVVLSGDAISSQRPDVPGLLFDGQSWRLQYPLRSGE